MATLNVYAVYDAKVKYFHNPMVMRNRGEALRSWEQVANDEKSSICAHPSDFSLMELGTFDDQTGKIDLLPVPESLGLALQFKRLAETSPTLFDLKNAN